MTPFPVTPFHAAQRCVTLILAVFLLSACSGPSMQPLAPGEVILAFGDSLTEGVGATREQSYPSRLAELSGHPVINAGVSGEVTAEGVERLAAVLDRHAPGLMILLLGGNDILRNGSQGEAKRNLVRMIEMARERDVQVLLVGVPEKSLFSSSAPLYEELAEEYGLPLMDGMVASLLKTPRFKSDQVHLNAAGYRAMAERIHERLVEEGAL